MASSISFKIKAECTKATLFAFILAPGFSSYLTSLACASPRRLSRQTCQESLRKSSLSAAFHALLPLQLINRMKSPTHHLAAAATFASCQIGETWTGKISPRSRLFKVISF